MIDLEGVVVGLENRMSEYVFSQYHLDEMRIIVCTDSNSPYESCDLTPLLPDDCDVNSPDNALVATLFYHVVGIDAAHLGYVQRNSSKKYAGVGSRLSQSFFSSLADSGFLQVQLYASNDDVKNKVWIPMGFKESSVSSSNLYLELNDSS